MRARAAPELEAQLPRPLDQRHLIGRRPLVPAQHDAVLHESMTSWSMLTRSTADRVTTRRCQPWHGELPWRGLRLRRVRSPGNYLDATLPDNCT